MEEQKKNVVYERTAEEKTFDELWAKQQELKKNIGSFGNHNTEMFNRLPLSNEGRKQLHDVLIAESKRVDEKKLTAKPKTII